MCFNIETITAGENTTPLPIHPHQTATDVTTGPVLVQVPPIRFVQVRDKDFPHTNEPTPSELNNSDQENVTPPVPGVPSPCPTFQAHTRVLLAPIPFTGNKAANSAIVQAITRVRNNVKHGNSNVAQIEEIIQITRTLQYRGTPSKDDEAAALVVQLHSIQQLESESDSSSSSPPADVAFPTLTVPSYAQVVAHAAPFHTRVHVVASRLASSQQRLTRGQWGAGSQACCMGARVPLVPQGIHIGAELLYAHLTRRAETPPPLGFNFNRRANFAPCIITNNRGRGIPACYTRVIMGTDPHVIGIIPTDNSQYGGPLYAIPDHDQGERPRYTQDDLWCFKFGADDFDWFKSVLEFIHDLSLTAEVTRYCEASYLFFQYQEEIHKIEDCMWQASQLKDASACRLEGANAFHRIEEALAELNCRSGVQHGLSECGCST